MVRLLNHIQDCECSNPTVCILIFKHQASYDIVLCKSSCLFFFISIFVFCAMKIIVLLYNTMTIQFTLFHWLYLVLPIHTVFVLLPSSESVYRICTKAYNKRTY